MIDIDMLRKKLVQSNDSSGYLNLDAWRFSDDDVSVLCDLLRNYPNVTSVNLTSNQIGDAGAKKLAALTSVEMLDLSENNISDDGVMALAVNSHIKRLNLSANNITDAGVKILLEHSQQLSLNISANQGVKDPELFEQIAARNEENMQRICQQNAF